MNNIQNIFLMFWVALGIFVMAVSYSYGLGGFHNPGSGLFPFILGTLLFLFSLTSMIRLLFVEKDKKTILKNEHSQTNFGKLALLVGLLLAYALFLETLGYLLTTFVILVLIFRTTSSKKWGFLLGVSALISLVTYFGFISLGIRFPQGILHIK